MDKISCFKSLYGVVPRSASGMRSSGIHSSITSSGSCGSSASRFDSCLLIPNDFIWASAAVKKYSTSCLLNFTVTDFFHASLSSSADLSSNNSAMLFIGMSPGKDNKSSSLISGIDPIGKFNADKCCLTGLGALDVVGDEGADTPAAKIALCA